MKAFMYLLLIFSVFFFFVAVLDLCHCSRASSSGGEQGYSSLQSVRGLIMVASLVEEHSSRHAGLSTCGSQA